MGVFTAITWGSEAQAVRRAQARVARSIRTSIGFSKTWGCDMSAEIEGRELVFCNSDHRDLYFATLALIGKETKRQAEERRSFPDVISNVPDREKAAKIEWLAGHQQRCLQPLLDSLDKIVALATRTAD